MLLGKTSVCFCSNHCLRGIHEKNICTTAQEVSFKTCQRGGSQVLCPLWYITGDQKENSKPVKNPARAEQRADKLSQNVIKPRTHWSTIEDGPVSRKMVRGNTKPTVLTETKAGLSSSSGSTPTLEHQNFKADQCAEHNSILGECNKGMIPEHFWEVEGECF